MKKLLLLLLLQCFIFAAFSQTGNIRGFVYDKKTGEPIIFTNVYLSKTSMGSSTDVNGYFNITQVPAGKYTLTISYIGYDTVRQVINLQPGRTESVKLFLEESTIKLDEFVVSAERQELKKDVYASITKVTPKQISKLPSIGAVPDLAQYLQVVPGVVFTGDQGGQLYIRGGSPIQNKVLLDGMVIYNPFHSIGLFSVFDYDIIRNADIFTGGFNANYGGRISSIMDITTRDGNKNKLSGKISGDTFGAKVLLEGPLTKAKEDQDGSISYVLSYKKSYLEQSSKSLYSYVTEDGIPFGFDDLYGKISLNSKSGSKVNIFGFNFNDKVTNYKGLTDFSWRNYGMGSNIVIVPGSGAMLVKANAAYSNYKINMESLDSLPRYSGISGFNMGFNFTYFMGDNQLDYGVEVNNFKTNFEFINNKGSRIEQAENTSEFAGFMVYKINWGRLIFEPGFRLQYYASLSESSFEPRLGLKYRISNNIRFKAAGGLYSQNLIAASSDKDVVNLFYGILSGPENLQEKFDEQEVVSSLQKSNHMIAGMEFDINSHFNLNIEGYYKYSSQLTEINRNKSMDDDAENFRESYLKKEDFLLEKGDAYGIDFLLKYDYRRLYIWTVYSLGYVNRTGEFLENDVAVTKNYNPHYDRRHNVNLMISYALGSDMDWELSCRWNYGSGFPFTPIKGFYGIQQYGSISDIDYKSQNEDLGILQGELNSRRMPEYHRLDITIKKKFFFQNESEMELTAGATNIYNRNNIFYADYISGKKVYQLPFLPTVGLSWKF